MGGSLIQKAGKTLVRIETVSPSMDIIYFLTQCSMQQLQMFQQCIFALPLKKKRNYRQSSLTCTILPWKCSTALSQSQLFLKEKLSCEVKRRRAWWTSRRRRQWPSWWPHREEYYQTTLSTRILKTHFITWNWSCFSLLGSMFRRPLGGRSRINAIGNLSN